MSDQRMPSKEEAKSIWQRIKESVPTVEEAERKLNARRKLDREKARMPRSNR